MKNNFVFCLTLLITGCFVSCNLDLSGFGEETTLEADRRMYRDAFAKLELNSCDSTQKDFFFYAKINDQEVCYNEGEDNYQIRGVRLAKWTTSTSSLTPSQTPNSGYAVLIDAVTTIPNLSMAESFNIISPLYDPEKNSKEAFEHFFYTGAVLPICNSGSGPNEGFEISLEIPYKTQAIIDARGEGNRICKASTIYGPDTNGFIKVDEVIEDAEDNLYYNYFVFLSFECDLFFVPEYIDTGLFAHVRDGQMVARVQFAK